MSKYKITVRMKTAQSINPTAPSQTVNPNPPYRTQELSLEQQREEQEKINQAQLDKQNKELQDYYKLQGITPRETTPAVKTTNTVVQPPVGYTPFAGSYANSYYDPSTGRTVYLDNKLQPTVNNQPIYSTQPELEKNPTYKQIENLRSDPNRDNPNEQYKNLVLDSTVIPADMNQIRIQALEDQRQSRKQGLQNQNNISYNYSLANTALGKVLLDLGMQNYNAVSLEANQESIFDHINNMYALNPKMKALAIKLLNDKISFAGSSR